MGKVRTMKLLITPIIFALLYFDGATAHAGSDLYRCKMADGTIEITDKSCSRGTLDKHYDAKELRNLSSTNNTAPPRKKPAKSKKSIQQNTTKIIKKRYPSDYATSATLQKVCGKKFDGVNSTNLAGLQRSLQIRQSENRMFQVDYKEISELKCRIRRLEKVN